MIRFVFLTLVLIMLSVPTLAQSESNFSISLEPQTLTPSHLPRPSFDNNFFQGGPSVVLLVKVSNPENKNVAIRIGDKWGGAREEICLSEVPLNTTNVIAECDFYYFGPGPARFFAEVIPASPVGQFAHYDGPPLFSCATNKTKGCSGHFSLLIQ